MRSRPGFPRLLQETPGGTEPDEVDEFGVVARKP
jgi:hypothetical protein